jgi:hypothetical protein
VKRTSTSLVDLELPLEVDVPADHEPDRRLECEHARPAALAAVDATVIYVAPDAGLEDHPGELPLENVVVGVPPAPDLLGEDAEGFLGGSLDDGRGAYCGVGCCCAHRLSLTLCSAASLKDASD